MGADEATNTVEAENWISMKKKRLTGADMKARTLLANFLEWR